MILHPYKLGSRSAKRLREALNTSAGHKIAWVLTRPPRANKSLIVNWGASEINYPEGQHWIVNPPKDVRVMSDKVLFFQKAGHDKSFLDWTTDRSTASEWGVKSKIFIRNLTRGSGGRGIDVWEAGSGSIIPAAPLYTRHQPKTHEYRVHMARSLNGSDFEPILIQRKVWKNVGEQPKSWDVRSHDNGFIFQSYPDTALDKVPETVKALGRKIMSKYFPEMHFAALDVLYHKPTDVALVCEGNTAPGLENNTVDVYAHYFRGLMEEFKRERSPQLWRL